MFIGRVYNSMRNGRYPLVFIGVHNSMRNGTYPLMFIGRVFNMRPIPWFNMVKIHRLRFNRRDSQATWLGWTNKEEFTSMWYLLNMGKKIRTIYSYGLNKTFQIWQRHDNTMTETLWLKNYISEYYKF